MTDRWVIRAVVVILGVVATICVSGGFALAYADKQIPDALIALGSAAVGGVAALLARTGSEHSGPIETVVMNKPDDPVPTIEEVPDE